jgi:uncharacterized protein YecT (DUF1311 family)
MKFLALFLFAILSNSALADTTPQFNACLERADKEAVKNPAWIRCITEEQARQDARMKKEFLNVYKYSSEEQRKELTEGQRNWLAKREKVCRDSVVNDPEPVANVNFGICRIEHTDKWANVLRSLEPN